MIHHTIKLSDMPLHNTGFQSNPSLNFEDEISHLAKMFCDNNYAGEPLTMDVIYDCFEKAFKAGTQYLGKSDNAKMGELYVYEGKMLFNLKDSVDKIVVEVDKPGEFIHNNKPCQEITTYYIFNNEDKTILSNREIYVIWGKEHGKTEIPAGHYEYTDYLIARALHDQKF